MTKLTLDIENSRAIEEIMFRNGKFEELGHDQSPHFVIKCSIFNTNLKKTRCQICVFTELYNILNGHGFLTNEYEISLQEL